MTNNFDPSAQLKAQGYIADEIVTGEAVVLELPAATSFSRLVSGGIDFLFYALLLIGTVNLMPGFDLFNAPLSRSMLILLFSFYLWILPAIVTIVTRGFSLGKFCLGIRVVNLDGGTISAKQAFIRAMIAIFEVWITFGVVATVVIFLTRRAQRIGDLMANTYAVRWPKKRDELALKMPPNLQRWADSAQTRPLPAGLTLNIVNHFKTVSKLTDDARKKQAQVLAATAEKYVAPPVPWGTQPEDFLVALLLLRSQIETENNLREIQAQQKIISQVQKMKF